MKFTEAYNLIKTDCQKYFGLSSFFGILREYQRSKGFRFTFWLRLCNVPGLGFFAKIIRRHYTIKFGYEISEKTSIGKMFAIMHIGGIVINEKAVISDNVTIYNGVTLGGGWKDGVVYAPQIGKNCWIGPHAVIVGKCKIGDNVMIAGNAFVNFDVPDNSLVIGNPGIIKENKNSVKTYMGTLV